MDIPGISGGVPDEMANRPVANRQGKQKLIAAIAQVSWRKLGDMGYCVTARQGPRALSASTGGFAQGGCFASTAIRVDNSAARIMAT